VRKFETEPLGKEEIDEVIAYLDSIKPLINKKTEFRLVDEEVVSGKAPHYILAYCEANTSAYINVGYILQHVDLFIQSKGWGSCWLGNTKPSTEKDQKGLPFCIMLAFGRTTVPLRKELDEFHRLPLATISDNANDVAAAARLAPSAVNSQPWRIKFVDDEASRQININYVGRGALKFLLKKKLNKIDLGILVAHIVITLEHFDAEATNIKITDIMTSFSIALTYSNWQLPKLPTRPADPILFK
jgi:hypothetical protein